MRNKADAIGIILGVILLLMGIAVTVVTVIAYKNYFYGKANFVPIDAVVVDYHQTEHEGSGTEPSYYMYTPIVEFEVEGVKYRVHSAVYAKRPSAKIGDIIKIRYNKENPNDVIFEKDSSLVIGTIGSLAFTIGGLALLAIEIKRIKKAKETF